MPSDLGVERVFVVANKVRPGDEVLVTSAIDFLPLLGILPYDSSAVQVDLAGGSARDLSSAMLDAARAIKARLEAEMAARVPV